MTVSHSLSPLDPQTPRPIAMKKDGVQTRKRKPKNVANNEKAPGRGGRGECSGCLLSGEDGVSNSFRFFPFLPEKVLPSLTMPPPPPKMLEPPIDEVPQGQGQTGQDQQQQQQPPTQQQQQQHYLPAHSQSGAGPGAAPSMVYVRPMRHVNANQ